jgi:alpha-glucosidase
MAKKIRNKTESLTTTPPNIPNLHDTTGHDRFEDVFEVFEPNEVTHILQLAAHHVRLICKNDVSLDLITYADFVHFAYLSPQSDEPFVEYAIDSTFLAKQKTVSIRIEDGETFIALFIGAKSYGCIRIEKNNLHIAILDHTGNIIQSDAAPSGYHLRRTLMRGTCEVKMRKAIQPNERFYGLGDKSTSLQLRGKKFQNWNTDAYAFGAQSDPLYRTIPFFLGKTDQHSYGIFFDNTYRTHFDFGHTQADELTFSAQGGNLQYYFICRPTLGEVSQTYTLLTGVPELPPLWALGFHQSRWSYFPDNRVRELAADFRRHRIPCDAIYLDIDYMSEFRCFTWDERHFPAPAELIAELKTQGFQTVVMIDPGIKVDENYEVYSEGVKNNYYLKRPNGALMVGQVWPGASVYPDFTNKKVCEWWGNLYQKLYNEQQVAGFWNDMNEPACFKVQHMTIPDEVMHDYEGHGANHAKIHNVYGMQMSLASQEGLKRLQPQKRPFLLTRATYSGGQRYAAIWTGDNVASWEHLAIANRQVQRLAISGFSFAGTDIGGFAGDKPNGELMTRWMQLAVFHPFMRIHSMGNNEVGNGTTDSDTVANNAALDPMHKEPWTYGETYTPFIRAAIELRYRLLAYIYTAFETHVSTGKAMAQPIAFEQDTDNERDFYFGEQLLISPILTENCATQRIVAKGEYYDFHSGQKLSAIENVGENNVFELTTNIETMPILVRAGAAIPLYPVQQYVNERAIEELEWQIFGHTEMQHFSGILYEDAGESYEYQQGQYLRTTIDGQIVNHQSIEIGQTQSGTFEPTYQRVKLVFNGFSFLPSHVTLDDKTLNTNILATENGFEVVVPAHFKMLILG